MNKFSLTSIHCGQKFTYTADDNFLDKFSLSTRTDEQVLQCAKFFLDKCTCSKASMLAFEQAHLSRKNLTSFSLHTSK